MPKIKQEKVLNLIFQSIQKGEESVINNGELQLTLDPHKSTLDMDSIETLIQKMEFYMKYARLIKEMKEIERQKQRQIDQIQNRMN